MKRLVLKPVSIFLFVHVSIYKSCLWWTGHSCPSFFCFTPEWEWPLLSQCGMGDRCAMKFGPRIGKLCDCGRGANCNSYLLKCIWRHRGNLLHLFSWRVEPQRAPRGHDHHSNPGRAVFVCCLRLSMEFLQVSAAVACKSSVNTSCKFWLFAAVTI